MLKNITQSFINSCNSIELTLSEYIVIDGKTIPIKADLKDDCYNEGNIIGTFIFKEIQFEVSNDVNFKEKEFEYYKRVNGESVKIGTFITTEVKDSDTKEITKVTGMDYGLKTQIEYASDLNYESGEITLLDVWNECCELAEIESGITSFANDDFIVENDQYTGTGSTIRDVMIGVAMSSGNFVKVMNDDKVYLVLTNETDEIIEEYTELQDKRDTHPITIVRLGMKDVEGQYAEMRDEALIERYGENYLIINDNPFAYTIEKREALIEAIFNRVKGFAYSSFVADTSFKPYLTCGDKIRFRNKAGQLVESILLRYNHSFDTIKLEAPSIISASVDYTYPENAITIAKDARVVADRANATVTQVVKEVSDVNSRIVNIQTDVGGINTTIADVKGNINDLQEEDKVLDGKILNVSANVNAIQNLFQITGGSNLIKNSAFRLKDEVWNFIIQDEDDYYYTPLGTSYDSSLIGTVSSKAVIKLKNVKVISDNSKGNIQVNLKNTAHSFSYSYKLDNGASGIVRLINSDTNEVVYEETLEPTNVITRKQFPRYSSGDEPQETFIATGVNYRLEIETLSTYSDRYLYVYDLMLNSGDLKSWEAGVGELTTTNVKMSEQGLEVISSDSDIATIMGAEGFGVYPIDSNGNVTGEAITDFDKDGLITGIARTEKVYTGHYVMEEMNFDGTEHHIEYFRV